MSKTTESNEKLAEALYQAAAQAFGNKETGRTWMTTRLATMNYRRPIDVAIESHKGEIRVKRDLMHIKAALS